jgi:hypothetical protein
MALAGAYNAVIEKRLGPRNSFTQKLELPFHGKIFHSQEDNLSGILWQFAKWPWEIVVTLRAEFIVIDTPISGIRA